MRNRILCSCIVTAAVLLLQSGGVQAASEADSTVVTSDKLTYDSLKQYALFEGNVVVTDPQMSLKAEKLTLFFDETGAAKSIRAEGGVDIAQDDVMSHSDNALYDMISGRVLLSGSPVVTKGDDTLTGRTITFWRDQNKMVVDGRAKLVISPNEDGGRQQLLGDF